MVSEGNVPIDTYGLRHSEKNNAELIRSSRERIRCCGEATLRICSRVASFYAAQELCPCALAKGNYCVRFADDFGDGGIVPGRRESQGTVPLSQDLLKKREIFGEGAEGHAVERTGAESFQGFLMLFCPVSFMALKSVLRIELRGSCLHPAIACDLGED